MRLKQPVFSEDIKVRIKKLQTLDNYNGILSVLYDWMCVIGSAYINNFLFGRNILFGLLFYPIAAFIIASRIRGLSSLLHESTHRALAKSKWLNDILGSVCSGWCVFQSWTGYHYHHIILHHPFLGDPVKDPDFVAFIKTGLYDEGTTRADVIKFLKNIPSPQSTISYMSYLVKDRVLPNGEKRTETFLRIGFWILTIAGLYQAGFIKDFLLYWVLPMLTTANYVGVIAEMLEHYPLLHKDVDELHASRNKFCGIIGDFVLNPHGDAYHLLHHIFPRIPHWKYEEAHQILLEDENYRAVNQCGVGFKAQMDDMLSHFD